MLASVDCRYSGGQGPVSSAQLPVRAREGLKLPSSEHLQRSEKLARDSFRLLANPRPNSYGRQGL